MFTNNIEHFPDLIVEPAINGSQDSPYPSEEVNPEEPSFVQLTRLEPGDNDQHSGIGIGDYSDDPHQVKLDEFAVVIANTLVIFHKQSKKIE